MTNWPIHLYAILSADDCIADAQGKMPEALMNDADWRYFQAELDSCALIVLGRESHLSAPNTARRRRVVMSRQARGLTRQDEAHWWNPADVPLEAMLRQLAPQGGKIGVPGGQAAFDYFLENGMESFHLTRAHDVLLPGGRKVFSGPGSAEARLAAAGLAPGEGVVLDAAANMTLTVWSRPEGEEE
jgi:dihydrofolate reductase